ncbi:MAG: hypothetical protein ACLTBV_25260 [Enterocloster bolteae]
MKVGKTRKQAHYLTIHLMTEDKNRMGRDITEVSGASEELESWRPELTLPWRIGTADNNEGDIWYVAIQTGERWETELKKAMARVNAAP